MSIRDQQEWHDGLEPVLMLFHFNDVTFDVFMPWKLKHLVFCAVLNIIARVNCELKSE